MVICEVNKLNEFEEYEKQGEPEQKEKSIIWQTAIGLQEVDGLKPSNYLIETAKSNIEGDITIEEAKVRIENYYEEMPNKDSDRTEEADKVSSRIAEILSEKTFHFSSEQLISIHKRLFHDIYRFAGEIRDYNITKKEWVLDGDTISYVSHDMLKTVLEHDFNHEKEFDYSKLDIKYKVEHIIKFISDIWQIHPFGEGNTRTVAVFTIKYLKIFGFDITNDMFATNSWYFRNSLVRANYSNFVKNVSATYSYLNLFFENLLFNGTNKLENKHLHIGTVNSRNGTVNGTVKLTTEEKIKSLIRGNSSITANTIATTLDIGLRTVKRYLQKLKENNEIERIGSDKTGYWKIIKK
jgi:fido (protein-threonine AMPylation protein)